MPEFWTPDARHGQLTVDGTLPLQTSCTRCTDLTQLLDFGDLTDDDVAVSGEPGFATNPVFFNGLRRTLSLIILGSVDKDGTPYDDNVDGFLSNYHWIRTNLGDPTGTGDGTRALTLSWGSFDDQTAVGRIGPTKLTSLIGPGKMTATIDVWLPHGPFVVPA